MALHAVLILVTLLTAGSARAQGPLGTEFQVNSYTSADQYDPAVCHDAAGNFVVAWTDYRDSNDDGVFARRFNSAGMPVGTEFLVNTYTTNDAHEPTICCDDTGSFVVAWENYQDGSTTGIFGQRFSSTGMPAGTEFQVNTYTTDYQEHADINCGPGGTFVVVWESNDGQDGDGEGTFGQRYDSAGMQAGTEFQVNTYTDDDQEDPSVCCDDAGNFVVVWESDDQVDGTSREVFGQRYASNGMPQGTEFQVNTYTTDNQENPDVCCDATGRFVAVWESENQVSSDNDDVFGQRFDSGGAPAGTEFQVNTYTTGYQYAAEVCCDAASNFVVVWSSKYGQDGSYTGIFGQRFSSAGTAQGTEFQVNTYTSDYQTDADISCADNGQFVVVWESDDQDGSGDGVFARLSASQVAEQAPAMSWAGLAITALVLLGTAARSLRRRGRARRFD